MLPLKSTIVYGPVQSRRLGRSLGINLLPAQGKLCSFDCVYCQYGRTPRPTLDPTAEGLPTVAAVAAAVERALQGPADFDTLTFSGNGEPTLHPDWPAIVEAVRERRDRYRPTVRLAVLSNASTAGHPRIQATLGRLEAPIMKLDAGDEATFAKVNCPAQGISLAAIVDGLAVVPGLVIQTLLLAGTVSNSTGASLEHWLDVVARLNPVAVQVYSIDRPVPAAGVEPVPPDRLQQIAARLAAHTGREVHAYWRPPAERR